MDLLLMARGLSDPILRQDPHFAAKPWYYGTILSLYSFFAQSRATFNYAWVISIPSDVKVPTSPVHIYGQGTWICNLISLWCGLGVMACFLLRLREAKIARLSAVACGLSAAQFGLTLSALIIFLTSFPKNVDDQSYSSGFIAALLSCALNLISACLYLIDCTLLRHIAKAYSGHQHKLLISFMLAMWYVIIGGFIFASLEEWPYEEAVEFVVVTLLTIGYGTSTPSSDSTKLAVILYGSIGLVVVGFFVLSIGDNVVEKAERQLQLKLLIARRRKRKRKKGLLLDGVRVEIPLMNPGRHHHRSQAVALSNYPVNGLHSLPTFTRPYFASLPRSGSEISIVSTKSAAAERLVDSIPLVKRNPPPMKPLHHVYSSMRDARFGKVRDLEADMFSFAPLESSPSLAASVKTTPKSSPLRKSPTAPRISSPLASPATKESSSELEFQDDDDDDFRIRMPLLDKSRLKDALPQDWISHYDPASTTEDKDGSSEISSIKKACLNGSEEDNEEDIGIESDDCGQHETPSRPHHSLFTSTPDASPEARPFTLQRHRHGPTQFEDSEELLQNNDSGETTDNIADSGLSATAAMAASQHKLERFIIYRVVFWIMIWWIGSAFLFAIIEDHWTLLDGFYFTFTTMATVGYGDLSLRSPWSWEVWYFFIFQGVAILTFCIEGCGHDLGYRVNRRLMKFYLKRLERKDQISVAE